MKELYKITYEDNSIFLGGDLNDSKWNLINKPIKKIGYQLGTRILYMEGYEEYNHIIIRQNILTTQEQRIKGILLMGNYNNKISIVELDFIKNKISTYEKIKGKEYNNSLTTGWKPGTKTNPYFTIV